MSLSYKEQRVITVDVHAYSVNMTEELRDAFKIFFRICGGRCSKPVQLQDFIKQLSDYQSRNFSRLQHFGLIELHGKTTWHLTPLGQQFYLGQAAVKSPCGWMEAQTLPDDHPAWRTLKGKRELVRIDTPLGRKGKRRKDYEKERRGDTLLSDRAMEKIETAKTKALRPHMQPQQQSMFSQNVTEPHNFG